jgi:hypothetical protein
MKKVNDPLTDEDILAEVRYQSSQASGSEFASDELTSDRTAALKAYLGKPIGNEIDGNSTVQSLDVADMVDAMLSQIMPVFSSDDIAQFEATNEEDEEQARTESAFCNHIIMERNNGFMLLETLLKDALLSKNATAKVRVDIKEDVEKERYKGLTEDEMFQVMQPTKPNQVVDFTKFDQEAGDVNLKRITTTRKLIVEAVAPENFSITSEHKSPYLDECTYCRERYWSTKSDLIEQGFDPVVVMNLPTSTADTKVDSIERNQIDDEQNFFNTSPSMQIVELEEHYIRIDQDGDGVAELHKVLTCENTLLENEEVDCVPYANGVAWLMGHRFYGLSAYDKLKNVQASKTHMLRQIEDNARAGNHQKTRVIEDQVNMDDFTNGRHNAIQRVESMDAAMDIPVNDITPSCILVMDYWDKVRTERTGSALDLQANQMTMPSNVGDQGVNTLIANLEQVSSLITKNFCETLVKSTYGLVHKFMRLYMPEDMQAKQAGQWTQTNPSQWLEREQINLMIPPTRSEKLVQQVAIEKAILSAQADMQMGKNGITTSDSQIYQMKLDHMRLSGIDSPQKYLINPDSPEAQQQAQNQAQMQQQEQMRQEQKQDMMNNQLIQAQIMEIQRNWENDKEELQFQYTELAKKLEMEKYKTDVKAEMDEAGIVGDATTKIELEAMKGEAKPGANTN